MTDTIDQAQAFDALNLRQSLDAQALKAKHAPPPPKATGYCLNRECTDDLAEPGRLYCGPSCAEKHHRQMKNHTR